MNTVAIDPLPTAAATLTPAPLELCHQVTQQLYREARLFDEERLEEWLAEVAHPDIHYQVFSKQLRMRNERRYTGADRVYAWDERLENLQMKLRAFRCGMQWSADPQERLRHHLSNIEVYLGEQADELHVYSNAWTVRNRRVSDEATFSYGRQDRWQHRPDGTLRLLHRVCDVDQRYLIGKNLGFFL